MDTDTNINNRSIDNPITVIEELFQKNCQSLVNQTRSSPFNQNTAASEEDELENLNIVKKWGITDHFEKLLADDAIYQSLPQVRSVSESDASIGRLVRMKCMVQDIFDPQFYSGLCRIKNTNTNQIRYETNAFKNSIENIGQDEVIDHHFEGVTFERGMLFCIPIPCQNNWAVGDLINNNNNNNQQEKVEVPATTEKKSTKRSLENDDIPMVEEIKEDDQKIKKNNNNNNNNDSTTTSKATSTSMYEKESEIKKAYNYPISGIDGHLSPFIVKTYDGKDQEFKINEIVEFVGVVSKFSPSSPTLDNNEQIDQMTDILMNGLEIEDQSHKIPESLVPQLHAIAYRQIDPYLLPNSTTPFNNNNNNSQQSTNQQPTIESILEIRKELITYLTNQLNGDSTAAEYFLVYLFSKVYLVAQGLCLGNFSLNVIINQNDQEIVDTLEELLQQLVSRSHRFKMTVDNLDDGDIIPFKDYDRNRIVSGLLQLPKNTHLIIDETQLREGTLHKQGLRNLQAIKDLALFQRVEYDFEYHPIEIKTDIQLLITSFGKSLTPAFCQVKLNKKSLEQIKKEEPSKEKLNQFRQYIGLLMNNGLEASSQQVTKAIEDDFVGTRQRDPDTPQEIFHYWLTLARILAISFGEKSISLERWNYMKQLELKRII
ncbi:UPF0557 family protein [Cavenderia fasciculata]|uniref:UPF0557 family protein n=1 Tax=Cavenderia fasciculata TaxID=261658 RepID=F4Q9W7_CACFS|nr:UPF0557 family protein [Cavenderia fasciculata]EGG15486.1 UPF0557 family protein [Cavenderia fasciculata]|eukprot:XP_004354228.1 UPF0557 family protein [Cavenderia fasciculata]